MVLSNSQQTMKTIKTFACLAAMTLSFAACQKNEVLDIEASTFTFTSARPQLEGETKTEYTGTTIQWSKGDDIRMAFTVDGVWQTTTGDATVTDGKSDAKMYASTKLSAAAETAEFSIPNKFTGSQDGEYVFYTIYPSSASNESFTYAPSATVRILNEQTPTATSFASGADVMFGMSAEKYTSKPSAAIPLEWTRLVAHGDITLKGLKNTIEGETITNIVLTAQEDADLVGTHYFDVITNNLTLPASNTTANVLTVYGDNLSIDENGDVEFWISILPATITSLKVEVETSKATYTREISEISLAFAQNKRNTLAIKMDGVDRVEKAPVTQMIANGNYVIAYDNNMMVASATGSVQGVSTLVTKTDAEGNLIADEAAIWNITFDSENEVYYVSSVSEKTYLSGAANGTNLKLVEAADKVGFRGTDNKDGTYQLTLTASGTTRGIGYNYNNGNARFGMYDVTSTNYGTTLKLIPAVVDTTPSLSFPITSKNAPASATTITFSYEAKYLTENPTVKKKTDNNNIISTTVAPVAQNGVVTVTLVPNTENIEKTAVLTVSATGVDDIDLTIVQAAYTGTSTSVDVLTQEWTGISGTSYSSWSDKAGSSSTAVYAGNSAGGNDSIQLRSSNNNSGVVSTTSGGKVKKVVVTWNSNTANGRVLNVYGSNTAYTAASDLYGDNAGTLLGTIVNGTSTELEITGDYSYIGFRSNNSAMYLTKVEITWE